ncbi:hypothetical protein N9192_01135 [Akkermansiaceae bacterium]|nr:hypothetical protein [Akkermansiaceae bacterium]MDB4508165.1 hypothetical protein [Akkermansiaceae bacterium]MDB4541478.1 hypothetical protein [Akkermansiaceae bacterium]
MSENPYLAPQTNSIKATDDIARQMQGLQWPLKLSFKVLALASQATVTDANGKVVCYTKQKLFKFREHVEIFTDKTKTTLLAEIKTKKIIDWSARYHFTDANGGDIGSVGRRGWRSMWRAHYEVFNSGSDHPDLSIREENAAAKFFDSILGEIPIIGFFTGYFFHPRYAAAKSSGEVMMRMTKQSAFWEGRFLIEKPGEMTDREELNLIMSYLMMVLLERKRG